MGMACLGGFRLSEYQGGKEDENGVALATNGLSVRCMSMLALWHWPCGTVALLALFMSVPAPRSYGVVWRVAGFTCLLFAWERVVDW
jgi:CBS-domain-containing membrane protein